MTLQTAVVVNKLASASLQRSLLESCQTYTKGWLTALELWDSLDSTNQRALAYPPSTGAYACLAEQQTGGRGRRGKSWLSPSGCNIYLSIAWDFPDIAKVPQDLSLGVGVAVVRALEQHGAKDLMLKWPNDIVWQGCKLAGVLMELGTNSEQCCKVVAGLGLNVAMPDYIGQQLQRKWVNFNRVVARDIARHELVPTLIDNIVTLFAEVAWQNLYRWRDDWQQYDLCQGKQVAWHDVNGNLTTGIALGVSETGHLRVQTPEGVKLLQSGDISIYLQTS